LDTNGHGNRPYSKEYLENISIVDEGLRAVEEMVETYFEKDGKTAYVFTADHGMNNRGAHGDGDPQNTETPLITWGAGIKRATLLENPSINEQSRSWELQGVERTDLHQADITPLMSSLIGVPYPMNSEGSLPIPLLDNTEAYKAEAVYKNALELLAQYRLKVERRQKVEISYVPFEPLQNVEKMVSNIEYLLKNGNYHRAETESYNLMNLTILGLRYLQTYLKNLPRYDWQVLRSIVASGYTGWIVFSLIFIVKMYTDQNFANLQILGTFRTKTVVITAFLTFGSILYRKESPLSYYGYLFFPILFWCKIMEELPYIKQKIVSGAHIGILAYLVLYIVTLEILVAVALTKGFIIFFPRNIDHLFDSDGFGLAINLEKTLL
jgi:GPI ethanolamine phosphate transferase 1